MGACFKTENKGKEHESINGSTIHHSKSSEKQHQHMEIMNETNDKGNIVINNDLIVQSNVNNPMNYYEFKKDVGNGAFGSVCKVVHKQTKSVRAMKKIKKSKTKSSEKDIINEINMLKKLDHLNLVKIYEFYIYQDHYYIIMDFCEKGELFDIIMSQGPFNEKQTAYIIYQLLSAVHFCHSSNIIHRDLKPENILVDCERKGSLFDIKVIDFGTAKIFDRSKNEDRRIGSSYYMAPEVLKKNYTEKCDLWSVGVIMYILLTKLPPFNGNNDEEIYESIRVGEYDLGQPNLDKATKNCKTLLRRLLEKKPEERISAEEALKHDWFNVNKTKEMLFVTAKKNIKTMLSKLCTYKPNYKLQQVAIAFIVHNVSQSEEIRRIFGAFQLIDENGDGRITKEELVKGLKLYDPSIENPEFYVEKIFKTIDTDNNGFLEFEEFARVIIDKKKLLNDDIIQYTFDFFDKDKNGEITLEELCDIFGEMNKENLAELVAEVDTDKNGKIDYNEFKEMMNKIMN